MKAGEKTGEVSGKTRDNRHPAKPPELSRRDFVKTSAAVSLVTLLPGLNYAFAQGATGAKKTGSQAKQKLGLAVWSHTLVNFGSKDDVARHVERLAEAGVNILIPIVKFPSGAVDFLTSLADINLKYPDWDPLKVLIENCQKRGIKVHPWLCVFTEGEHSRLLREHPEFVAKVTTGHTRWACAMRPEVLDYEFGLYKSVALRYRPDWAPPRLHPHWRRVQVRVLRS